MSESTADLGSSYMKSSKFELGLTKVSSIRIQKIGVYRCLTSLRAKEIVIKLFSAANVNSFPKSKSLVQERLASI